MLGLEYFPSIGVAGLAKILINSYQKQLLYVRIFLMIVETAGFPDPDKAVFWDLNFRLFKLFWISLKFTGHIPSP